MEKIMEEHLTKPWVIFTLQKERYAIASQFVRSMVAMPSLIEMPKAPEHVRGVINLRDQVIPLTDLRCRLGMDSFKNKIHNQVEMLKEREQDHLNWLNELKASVQEERPFTLATDHHKCKFGQWYDSYKPKSFEEAQFLKRFDIPHKRIHKVAIHVAEYIKNGAQQKAHELIEETRNNELSEMISLFGQFREMTKKQAANEIALVLEHDSRHSAISVDSVESVEKLMPDSSEPMPNVQEQMADDMFFSIAKTGKDNNLVYLLDAHKIIAETSSASL